MGVLRMLKKKIWDNRTLSIIWLIGAYFVSVAFMVLYGKNMVDADMASEMVLADFLNEGTGLESIISTKWFYSTELRVVALQPVFRIGLYLFPDNWHMVRVFACAVLMLFLAGSYIFFAYSSNLKRGAFWIAGVLLMPFSGYYWSMITYGGYYAPLCISLLLSFGFLLRVAKSEKRYIKIIFLILLAGVSFVNGLGGVRSLMNYYVPMFAAGIVLWVSCVLGAQAKERLRENKSELIRLSVPIIVMLVCSGIGYLINSRIFSKSYFFIAFSDEVILKDISISNILAVFSDFFGIFGWQTGILIKEPVLVSLRGIISFVGLVLPVLILFSAIRLIFRWNRLTNVQRYIVASFWLSVLVSTLVYSVVEFTGYGGYGTIYWIPIMPFAFMVLHVEGVTEKFEFPILRRLGALGIASCILLCSYATLKGVNTQEPMTIGSSEIVTISNWLKESGYKNGYATFWYSNIVTEHTNGEIEMWTVYEVDYLTPQLWLQEKSHAVEYPEGEVFIIMPADKIVWYEDQAGGNLVFQTDNFRVIGFEDISDLNAAMGR